MGGDFPPWHGLQDTIPEPHGGNIASDYFSFLGGAGVRWIADYGPQEGVVADGEKKFFEVRVSSFCPFLSGAIDEPIPDGAFWKTHWAGREL